MGTPCACAYAMSFFGLIERTEILPKYENRLKLDVRQIDDILILWQLSEDDTNKKKDTDDWNEFKADLNSATKLNWIIEEPKLVTNFLDLTIYIGKDNKIYTRTYQKPMNLFLYIPSHSAHPPGLTKSLIYGLYKTHFKQNTNQEDFLKMIKLLFQRMLLRGYLKETIAPVFIDAVKRITELNENPTRNDAVETKTPLNQLFLHLPYHPRDVSRNFIRKNYENTCNKGKSSFQNYETETGTMKINKFTIAYSRPKNLRDILSPSTLKETEDIQVSNFIK